MEPLLARILREMPFVRIEDKTPVLASESSDGAQNARRPPAVFAVEYFGSDSDYLEAYISISNPSRGVINCAIAHRLPHPRNSKELNDVVYRALRDLPFEGQCHLHVVTPNTLGEVLLARAQPGLAELCEKYGGQQLRPNIWDVSIPKP